jgi:hypothetical protein
VVGGIDEAFRGFSGLRLTVEGRVTRTVIAVLRRGSQEILK